jgi:HlyD family secretion protein
MINVTGLKQLFSRRKTSMSLIAVAVLAIAVLAVSLLQARGASADLQYETIVRGDLTQWVEASGQVRAQQSAELVWKTSGTVGSTAVEAGQQVEAGQVLVAIERSSLPGSVILAQADLVSAERALSDLKASQLQQAQAMKALDEARQALEDAQNPQMAQADALNKVALAQKELDEAERLLAITATPPSEDAISQAYANFLLAENVYNRTLSDLERIQKKLDKPESAYMFFESRQLYKRILDGLEQKEIRDRRSYEKAHENYQRLLEPVDPLDLAVAEANVVAAQARLEDAQQHWERIQDGYSPGELAVLEAQLKDAERTWKRWIDGPDPEDILAAEARVAAAQAVLNQVQISAPFSGVVTRLDSRVGDQVRSGTVALRMDDLSHLYVDVLVSEIDINQIRVGQPASLTFESVQALPDAVDDAENSAGLSTIPEYTGQVVEVARVGIPQNDVVQYKVTIEIDHPDEQIRPGVSADAMILVNEFQDVVQVPNQAVRFQGTRRIVFVAGLGQPTPVEVELGTVSAQFSQLLAGDLLPGDRVVIDPPEWLLDETGN